MKILNVSSSDIQGGAARAAYRLHKSLLGLGLDSQMLVQSKSSDDYTVIAFGSRKQQIVCKFRPYLDSLPVRKYKNRSKTPFSVAWLPHSAIVDKINSLNPDIVHLHWINSGMMRIEDIKQIKAPIVWTLHDMWPFTGGCHYTEECIEYKNKCGSCKVLNSDKQRDLSAKIHLRKKNVFSRINNLTVVGVSRWLADCARKSAIFSETYILNLANAIDTSLYTPIEKNVARKVLSLPYDKKIILFGAVNATGDPRKGAELLFSALNKIESTNAEIVIFGSSEPKIPPKFRQKYHYLGHLNDDVSLKILYSAADVMVVPSLQEAFGQTASESMACGTPVVAFGATGLVDIVDHGANGYLASLNDVDDLARGIDFILNSPVYDQLSRAARNKVVSTFDSKLVANQYIKLYEDILKK